MKRAAGAVTVVIVTLVGCKKPPATFEIRMWPKGTYDIERTGRATVHVAYDTPCGRKWLDFPLAEDAEANDDNVIDVALPNEGYRPLITHVQFDPKFAGDARIGGHKLDRAGTDVLELECGAPLELDGRAIEVPRREASEGANQHEATLFVTARTDQCFVDQSVAYGLDLPTRATPLTGANLYWLTANQYEYWFRPIAATTTVVTLGHGAAGAGKLVAAFGECEAER